MDEYSSGESEEEELEWQEILNANLSSETHNIGDDGAPGGSMTDQPDIRETQSEYDSGGCGGGSDADSCHVNPVSNSQIKSLELNDHKAGMEGLDKAKINKIIHDASKGSKFYENELRKERKVNERIAEMKDELKKFTAEEKANALEESSKLIKHLAMDTSRTLVHVDMDAFYAAVEMRDNPELCNVPMAVGGNSMLCTSNYLARKYGVRAAMPGFIARKLCSHLVIVPTHFDKYRAVSGEVQAIFREYDPNFAAVSLDEAHLDLTEYINENYMDYHEAKEADPSKEYCEIVVEEMRRKIFEKTELTASAGIACNTMLAKICSDMNKPNGQFYLKHDAQTTREFMMNLPIRKINGIGRVTEQMLKGLGIEKCEDLMEKRDIVYLLFSADTFAHFMNVAHGISSNRITHGERKSMSAERTFQSVSETDRLLEICREICAHLEDDLKKENLKGFNVTLKFKLSSFVTKTRSKTVSNAVCRKEDLYEISSNLLLKEIQKCGAGKKFELRLMGVRVCNFESKTAKKQCTVKTMFGTEERTDSDRNDFVPCPICGVPQLNKPVPLNQHIDECLTRQQIQQPPEKQSSQNKPPQNKHLLLEQQLEDKETSHLFSQFNSIVSENSELGDKQKPGCSRAPLLKTKGSGNCGEETILDCDKQHDEAEKNPAVEATVSRVQCPVCGELQDNDGINFNIHLDDCLTKSSLNQWVGTHAKPSKRKGIGEEGKDSRKKVTLEHFWGKK